MATSSERMAAGVGLGAFAKAEELREKMGAIETKAKKRWENNFC